MKMSEKIELTCFFMDRMYKCANMCRRYQTDTIEKNGRMSKFTLLVFNEGHLPFLCTKFYLKA